MSKFKNKIDKVYTKFTFELIAVIFITVLMSGLVETILKKFNFVIPSGCLTDFVVSLVFIFLVGFIIKKASDRYRLSNTQYLVLSSFVVLYWMIRFFNQHNNLYFQSMNWDHFKDLKFIDLFMSLPIVIILGGLFLKRIDKVKPIKNNSIYVSDEPHIPEEISVQAEKIQELILKGDYSDSFSIGVIGAWGYGKSSFLEEIKSLFEDNKQVIQVHFSPYLNHNEEEVAGEFFNALKSQIQPYSGALSKSISHYATSITKAYRRGEVKDLLNSSFSINSESAYELYKKVEDLILHLGRKIIIYIDDLDRLSAKEVVQVFKLIRNTSKFPRTFFIVSLDKNMVLKELSQNTPDSRKYIDKFFQLEINLPKIGSEKLRQEFYQLINYLSKKIPKAKSLDKLENVIEISSNPETEQHRKCLFDLYITNYRDVKKLYNQIANDISNIPDALDEFETNDYINFVLLRLKFPEIYNIILLNPIQILSLKQFNPKGIGTQEETNDEILDSLGLREKKYFYFQGELLKKNNDSLKSSSLTKEENNKEKNIDEAKVDSIIDEKKEFVYSKSELKLVKRTLELVFSISKPYKISLKREERIDAFYKMQFSPEHLNNIDFQKLIDFDIYSQEGEKFFLKLINENKWYQIVESINEHKIKSKAETKNIVKLIFYVLQNEYSLNVLAGKKFELLSSLLDSKSRVSIHKDKKTMLSDQEKVSLLNQYVFENKMLNIESRIYLVNWIKGLESSSGLWGYSNDELKEIGKKLFLEFLILYINMHKGWTSDGSILKKNFDYLNDSAGKENLLSVLENYLTNDNVEYFLTELIQLNDKSEDEHSIAFSYRLNDKILELFKEEEIFNNFFDSLQSRLKSPKIDEFLTFCKLQVKLGKPFIKYHFKNIYTPDRSFFTDEQYKRAELSTQFIFEINNDIRYFTPKFDDDRLKNKYIGSNEAHSAVRCVLFDVDNENYSNDELTELVFSVIHKELSDSTAKHKYSMPKLPIQIGSSIQEGTTPMITLIHTA